MSKPSRRSRGSVTIEDVARRAGVSAMTVSRVINQGKNVRDRTRARVLEAIEALRYSPNTAARSLAAGEATHIGLLYSNPSAAYLSQFLVGALDGARKAGCHLVIEACESENDAEQSEAARRLADADVEGVILPPPLSESVPILTELTAAGTPVVTVAMGHAFANALNVRMDDFKAAREMTEYLVSLGHRRIAMITGHPDHIASIERERGFRSAMEAAGLDIAPAYVEQGLFTFRSGMEAAERLLDLPDPPTAIFAFNDNAAISVVHVARARGLRVPEDLSVVGFDDSEQAAIVTPPLTTVRQPLEELGRMAVSLLLRVLENQRHDALRIELATKLVVRESTASPRVAATA